MPRVIYSSDCRLSRELWVIDGMELLCVDLLEIAMELVVHENNAVEQFLDYCVLVFVVRLCNLLQFDFRLPIHCCLSANRCACVLQYKMRR